MPNSHHDSDYVTWGRYAAEHSELEERVKDLEDDATKRSGKIWTLVIAIMTGFLLPMLVTALLAYAHIRSH